MNGIKIEYFREGGAISFLVRIDNSVFSPWLMGLPPNGPVNYIGQRDTGPVSGSFVVAGEAAQRLRRDISDGNKGTDFRYLWEETNAKYL